MCLPARNSICSGQASSGSSSATSTARLANGAIGSAIGTTLLVAHQIEADGAGRDRQRLAVLHPQHDPARRGRRRQAGIAVGRPGIGVVGRRQRRSSPSAGSAAPSPNVSSAYLTTSCPAAPTTWRKSCPQNSRRRKRARISRLSRMIAAGPGAAFLAPFGEDLAVGAEQRQPAGHRPGAIARPIIRGDKPRMQPRRCRGRRRNWSRN